MIIQNTNNRRNNLLNTKFFVYRGVRIKES